MQAIGKAAGTESQGRKAPMQKQQVLRAPLIAVLGLLAFLVVPAAAQAHHIDVKAQCDLKNNVATVTYRVDFIQFGGSAKPTTKGTVKVDNVVKTQVPTATINWGTEPGTLSGSTAAAADQTHVVKAEFQWKVNGKWASGTKSVTTNKCPKPANPNMTIQKDGPATKYVGDTAVFTIKVTNTGNTILPQPCRHRRQVRHGGRQGHAAEPVRPGRRLGVHLQREDHRRDGRSAGQHGLRQGAR